MARLLCARTERERSIGNPKETRILIQISREHRTPPGRQVAKGEKEVGVST